MGLARAFGPDALFVQESPCQVLQVRDPAGGGARGRRGASPLGGHVSGRGEGADGVLGQRVGSEFIEAFGGEVPG